MTGTAHIPAEAGPWLHRHGYVALAGAVMFEGTRMPLNGLVVGSARMPWRWFLAADLLGSMLRVSVRVLGIDTLDRHAAALHRLLSVVNPWVAGGALIAFTGAPYLLFRRHVSDGETCHVNARALASVPGHDRAAARRERQGQ